MVTQEQLDDADTQEIRLAVVLNGGVSLAVWMSGVALELHRLVQASRAADAPSVYGGLLGLLHARARIDVIAGTSAGGLNGGFLALGLVHGCDLTAMRGMWESSGDLAALLRDPREKAAPSLLRGDYFYDQVHDAYGRVYATRTTQPVVDEPVELFLTGTLWEGRRSDYTDDVGRRISELDHDATFRFGTDVASGASGSLLGGQVAEQLAVASRCTSSFPGAFEPRRVEVRAQVGDRWESEGGLANFERTQFLVDGGVLRNKPIRPALDAVYRQGAGPQVRRVMAYVVPDPGEAAEPSAAAGAPAVPRAAEVLMGVLTRLRSTDSVSRELSEIADRNEQARSRRRTRDRLAQTLVHAAVPGAPAGSDLPTAAFAAYREVRAEHAANAIPRLLLSGRAAAGSGWSRRELATELRELAVDPGLPFIPSGELGPALAVPPEQWRWGQSAVARIGDIVLDVLRRAMWLAPVTDLPTRAELVAARRALHVVLAGIRQDRAQLDQTWRSGAPLTPRPETAAASAADLATLRAELAGKCSEWEGELPDQRRVLLHGQALSLAGVLLDAHPALAAVAALPGTPVDPDGDELRRLRVLLEVLLTGRTADDVLRCLLRLEVLQVAFSGTSQDVEQEVELVQVSARRTELLTGLQEHHFGAFYRRSWRTNDWLRGRLDGSAQLVECLLVPERLRQLNVTPAQALPLLREIAVGPQGSPYAEHLAAAWQRVEPLIVAELAVLAGNEALPRTFPTVAARLADRLRLQVLEEELPALATAVDLERDAPVASRAWAAQYRTARREAVGRTTLPAEVLTALDVAAEDIGRQRIRAEVTQGSDTFARTASQATAAMTSVAGGQGGPKAVRGVLQAIRGYALLVWVLVAYTTSRSTLGPNALSMVVGVGAGLLGLALAVPGVPLAVTLAGAVLLLGATSAAALRTRSAGMATRLLIAALLLLVALSGVVWASYRSKDGDELRSALLSAGGKVGVVLVVVALGWFLSRAKPPAADSDPAPADSAAPPLRKAGQLLDLLRPQRRAHHQ